MKRSTLSILLTGLFLLSNLPVLAEGPEVVTLDTSAPLLQIRVMVKTGSAWDPEKLEGLAYLTGEMIIEGGFGRGKSSVTKDRLAEITRPWGQGAYPNVNVSKEITTFTMTVPRERLDDYLKQILQPMFTQPQFDAKELDRVRAETLQVLRSTLRFEQIELVGLIGLDNYIHENDGTGYAHPDLGTETGLEAVTSEAVRRFYATYYQPENIVVGLNTADPKIVGQIKSAFAGAGAMEAEPYARSSREAVNTVSGRSLAILALPNAISTGLHAGFPLSVTREDPDYWPLNIANIHFGTHRDGFSYLYQKIRAERGYNYGDYSYIEHFEGRPFSLFPPTNAPRKWQYFSIWIRPVQNEYAHHLMKAFTWELENFIRTGMTEAQCNLAKNKAKVLYLSLAETSGRLLGYKLDDHFYGMKDGYLDSYLKNVEGVTCQQVNQAIRKHLQIENIKYLVVTHKDNAPKLAEAIAADRPAWGKKPADYQIDVEEKDGQAVYTAPENKLDLIRRDSAWAHYWLDIPEEKIWIVPAENLFATTALPR
jgi:zinc protease